MLTNKEWLNSLAADNPHELQAWFDAPHANDDLTPKNDVTTNSVDDNDESAAQRVTNSAEMLNDSREKLEADAIQLAQNIWHQGQNYANGVREMRHIAWQKRDVIELLDRQDRITHLECMASCNSCVYRVEHAELTDELAKRDKGIERLKARRDELQEELENAHAKNRQLKAHISNMQDGRHGWHVEAEKLQAQVDNLARDLQESERLREEMREELGVAYDFASDLLSRRDRGLA